MNQILNEDSPRLFVNDLIDKCLVYSLKDPDGINALGGTVVSNRLKKTGDLDIKTSEGEFINAKTFAEQAAELIAIKHKEYLKFKQIVYDLAFDYATKRIAQRKKLQKSIFTKFDY